MTQYNQKFVQCQPFSLAGAGVNIGDSTIILTSMNDINGVALVMTDFGNKGFATIEPGNGVQEEQISFSGITQNGNGTATLTGVKTVLMKYPYTETSNLSKTHSGGTSLVISNTAGFYNELASLNDDETITGTWTFTNPNYPAMDTATPYPVSDPQLATKKYVDYVGSSGAADASTSAKGIAKLSAAPTSPTDPIAVGTNDVKVPTVSMATVTANQVAALAGTGTPNGTTGKYVTRDTLTSEEAAFELLANKDTTVTLGSSDTKYPSQNAVKTYVDGNPITSTNGVTTRAENTSSGSQTIAHGLGRIPKKVKITATWLNSAVSVGVYNGTTTSCVWVSNVFTNAYGGASGNDSTNIINIVDNGSGAGAGGQVATISVDGTNITLNWTYTVASSSGSSLINILWEAQ